MPQIIHSNDSTNLAELLERILDKGVVIAGDIRIKLVDIELLTINIRLLISSVEKARELGIDWWTRTAFLSSAATPELSDDRAQQLASDLRSMEQRLRALEAG